MASFKLLPQPVVFQLLKPIGGVRARPFGSGWAGAAVIVTATAAVIVLAAARRTAVRRGRIRCIYSPWNMGGFACRAPNPTRGVARRRACAHECTHINKV